ncbi:MAG: UDP-N-acetylmuramate-L-alanine ligase [Parcubacteria group bacterium GW2011_GWA2_45_30]|nr:MAG: UDP-N-acetylmuramate-L-alanine ligase [Parcubacteria group bacterium GW2011_GWA2_45_30]
MHIHFIGIGGIGMSALAKYYLSQGAAISGSDLASSEITDELGKMDVKIIIGTHKKSNLPKDVNRVIYTAATPKSNSELKEAVKRRIKRQNYAEAIGELTKQYKTITVSGAHGKSTTTALAALVLEEGHRDPTVIIGTKVKEFGNSNFRRGYGPNLVLEADEWNKSFLEYSPWIAIVTNIDAEHLDTYKNKKNVERAFAEFLAKVPGEGKIIANADDETLKLVTEKFGKKVIWYSLDDAEAGIVHKTIRLPGKHNISNALAALKLGRFLGIRETHILQALSQFNGTWRRFEFKGIKNGANIYLDYGHHPREIRATIQAARERFPLRRVWCVYQPHQYQRLAYLWDDFIGAFDMADRVVLVPVYDVAGRETQNAKTKVNSKKLAAELKKRGKDTEYSDSFAAAQNFIESGIRQGDVVLVMGAGDIYGLALDLVAVQ